MTVMEPPKVNAAADYINQSLNLVKAKNPAEPEFHQAVLEVFESLRPVLARHPEYHEAKILTHYGARTGSYVPRALVR